VLGASEAALRDKLLNRILDKNRGSATLQFEHQIPSRKTHWLRWAAAVIILLTAAGSFIFINHDRETENVSGNAAINLADVAPGRNKATLTLSNGSIIDLDDAKNGNLGIEGGSKILKVAEGQVNYTYDSPKGEKKEYNTMTTPRGGQYLLQLPDSTKVWLNAASSITFPVNFSDIERNVSITGEAYFEVTKNIKRPFVISINDQTKVRVLGTHFNISAYTDEPFIKTTLVEGSIRISHTGSSEILVPGQAASINKSKEIRIIDKANIEEALAWKNGFFQFEGTNLTTVMRQLSRWYDTEVIFEGEPPDKEFVGSISRNVNASGVLKMLAFAGVQFRIENRKIIVMSK